MCADEHPARVRVYVDGQAVPCAAGTSLLNALINAGHVVPTACGGTGMCHLCRVRVDTGADVPPPSDTELRALGAGLIGQGVRLSCRIVVNTELHVTLMPLEPPPWSR